MLVLWSFFLSSNSLSFVVTKADQKAEENKTCLPVHCIFYVVEVSELVLGIGKYADPTIGILSV